MQDTTTILLAQFFLEEYPKLAASRGGRGLMARLAQVAVGYYQRLKSALPGQVAAQGAAQQIEELASVLAKSEKLLQPHEAKQLRAQVEALQAAIKAAAAKNADLQEQGGAFVTNAQAALETLARDLKSAEEKTREGIAAVLSKDALKIGETKELKLGETKELIRMWHGQPDEEIKREVAKNLLFKGDDNTSTSLLTDKELPRLDRATLVALIVAASHESPLPLATKKAIVTQNGKLAELTQNETNLLDRCQEGLSNLGSSLAEASEAAADAGEELVGLMRKTVSSSYSNSSELLTSPETPVLV